MRRYYRQKKGKTVGMAAQGSKIKLFFQGIGDFVLPKTKKTHTYTIRVGMAVIVYIQLSVYGPTLAAAVPLLYIMACLYRVDTNKK